MYYICVIDDLSILLLFNNKDKQHGLAYELCRAARASTLARIRSTSPHSSPKEVEEAHEMKRNIKMNGYYRGYIGR